MPVLSDFIFFCCLPGVVTQAWGTQGSGFPWATGGIYDELSDDAERTRYCHIADYRERNGVLEGQRPFLTRCCLST